MRDQDSVLVVGAGLAGARTVESLRALGFDGPIRLVGDEAERPYVRPPLSKEVLRGVKDRESVFVHDSAWYRDNDVQLITGVHVADMDLVASSARLTDGSSLAFARLALTTGARSRTLDVPGADAPNVLLLRTLPESEELRGRLSTARSLVVVGSGWIGLEVAAAARAADVAVTVIEREKAPLSFMGPELSEVLTELHRRNGVEFRVGSEVDRIVVGRDGDATGVLLADGTALVADLVLVAVGAVPNDGLAVRAGLDADHGVLTGSSLRASHPAVFAAGDVAKAWHPLTRRHERVEHWANAEHQPHVAAAAMLGIPATYDRLPYFFSDQYSLSFELTGFVVPGEYDEVVIRGDSSSPSFSMFWRSAGQVVAGLAAGDETPFDQVSRLVEVRSPVPADRLSDVDRPIAEIDDVAHQAV
jgi:3-phenylpropionate/trans-cinnamate dioxygenase ferredoxin reductase component